MLFLPLFSLSTNCRLCLTIKSVCNQVTKCGSEDSAFSSKSSKWLCSVFSRSPLRLSRSVSVLCSFQTNRCRTKHSCYSLSGLLPLPPSLHARANVSLHILCYQRLPSRSRIHPNLTAPLTSYNFTQKSRRRHEEKYLPPSLLKYRTARPSKQNRARYSLVLCRFLPDNGERDALKHRIWLALVTAKLKFTSPHPD